MVKNVISTPRAPMAVGPYSQAVKAGGFIFVSGQLPIDPDSGELFRGSVATQTQLIIENLGKILEASGSSLAKAVKATIFLTDLEDFGSVNEVYARFFSVAPPARSTVEVSRLPKDVSVEIELIAIG
jgi:2-iminobutanoate/2-iminopropanoate deaminase